MWVERLLLIGLLMLPTTLGTSFACPCDPQKLWLDVVFVVESTRAVEAVGLDQVENYIATTLLHTSIASDQLRVGAVSYAGEAVAAINLTTYNSVYDFVIHFDLPYLGGKVNDAEKGLRAAVNMHANEGRDDVRKVIVLVASTLDTINSDPFEVAEDFYEDGGVLITIEFVEEHGIRVPTLSKLATTGYALSNANETLHSRDLLNAMCDANCYCPRGHFALSEGPRGTPDGGCYLPSTLTANRMLAERTCHQLHEGAHLPVISDAIIDNYMFSEYDWKENINLWLGLRIVNGTQLWDANFTMFKSPFSNVDFVPPPIKSLSTLQGEECVYATQSNKRIEWVRDSCSKDYLYVCQSLPYSTSNRIALKSHSHNRILQALHRKHFMINEF